MAPAVAIVGAGPAGAAAAYALRDAPGRVTVLEARPRPGGRATSRSTRGCRWDAGANYVKPRTEAVADLLRDLHEPLDLVDVRDPVWTVDGAGRIAPGRDDDAPKWTARAGLDRLPAGLLDRSGATVETNAPVSRLARTDGAWALTAADGRYLGRWDHVVLTPPAPRTAALLDAADWDDPLRDDLREAAAAVSYRPLCSIVLHYPFPIERPWYALVDVAKVHELGWVAREGAKPGHVPAGEALLVVQPSPGWSADRLGLPVGRVAAEAAPLVADLLDDDRLRDPDWVDGARWPAALPDAGADTDVLDRSAAVGLHFAGDWTAGEARVHAALRPGLGVGDRLAAASGG